MSPAMTANLHSLPETNTSHAQCLIQLSLPTLSLSLSLSSLPSSFPPSLSSAGHKVYAGALKMTLCLFCGAKANEKARCE